MSIQPDLNLTEAQADAIAHCTDCGGTWSSYSLWYHGKKIVAKTCYNCSVERHAERWPNDHVLRSSLLTHAALNHNEVEQGKAQRHSDATHTALEEVYASYNRLHDLVKKTFEPVVWFGGLQKRVQDSKVRGLKMKYKLKKDRWWKNAHMLVWSSAGRVLMTLEYRDGTHITLIAAEDESAPRMGIQGICATEQEASDLLNAAVQAWKDTRGKAVKADRNVGFI